MDLHPFVDSVTGTRPGPIFFSAAIKYYNVNTKNQIAQSIFELFAHEKQPQ